MSCVEHDDNSNIEKIINIFWIASWTRVSCSGHCFVGYGSLITITKIDLHTARHPHKRI